MRKHLQRYHKLAEQHALMQVGSSLKNVDKPATVQTSPTIGTSISVERSATVETSLSVDGSPTIEKSGEIDTSSYIGRACLTCDELYRVGDLEAHVAQCRASEPTSTTQDVPEPGMLFVSIEFRCCYCCCAQLATGHGVFKDDLGSIL